MKGKSIIAIEIDNHRNEISRKRYKSMYAAGLDLNINTGLIKYCCEGKNRVKSGFSKNEDKKDIGLFMNNFFKNKNGLKK